MLDVCARAVEQAVALGGPLSKNSTGCGICNRRPLSSNLRSALVSDSRELPPGPELQRLLEIIPTGVRGRPGAPTGRKVQRRVGSCRALFRTPPTKAGPVCPSDASGFRVRTDATSDSQAVCGVVQQGCHLTSTRYRMLIFRRERGTSSPDGTDGSPDGSRDRARVQARRDQSAAFPVHPKSTRAAGSMTVGPRSAPSAERLLHFPGSSPGA